MFSLRQEYLLSLKTNCLIAFVCVSKPSWLALLDTLHADPLVRSPHAHLGHRLVANPLNASVDVSP